MVVRLAFYVFTLLFAVNILAAETRGISIKNTQGQKVGTYGASYALLIGVGDYTNGWPDLGTVRPEMTRVATLLKTKGFEVRTVFDPTSKTLKDQFEKFLDDYGYESSNRLLIYFAGHGYTRNDGNKGYLVPTDAPNPTVDERGFLRSAYAMTDLIAFARRVEANHALFLFDSCFSGTIFKTRALPATPQLISKLTSKPVRQFITAGDAGEEVPARSVFTPAFIDSLEYGLGDLNSDGYVTGTELGLYLQSTVPRHAQQSPQFGKINDYELSRGDFVFSVSNTFTQEAAITSKQEIAVNSVTPTLKVDLNDLTGRWAGRYYYEDGRDSVPFEINMYANSHNLKGTISETSTFGDENAVALFADLKGTIRNNNLQFSKTYDGTGGQTHSIDYRGELDSDKMSAKGRWHLAQASGRFEIYRR